MHENRRRYWRRPPIIVPVNTVTNSHAGDLYIDHRLRHTHTRTHERAPCQGHQNAADEADKFGARR